ncbi:MAG: TMEM198/TM7SF3 family protein [Thermomicrobiales bacterium]|nr:TMEM198/TM7SF3 family protein [Thermomicrobiales bacterium]MCO5218520.1 TMEM198/TM7SF3 family protein [Thermomicrobiales bacterium]MCO5224808.1 TMEM198/TM7SF3 family protein [Thermomicrobiales bacterium]MCO5227620.1 TMEM198/TM7SF3 family protein [Thermomicrobiales bacterium]
MDIFMGIILALLGIVVATSGLRVFFFMLPIVGFVAGFFAGATIITNWFGDGFLSTMTGWVVGFVLGVLFSIISYLWWYVGALLSAGAAGALLLSGLFSAFGVSSGILLTSFAIVGAVLFFVAALVLNLPVFIVLVNTAIIGAYMVVAGALLVFNRADLDEMGYGVAVAAVRDSWFWWLVLVAVAAVGIGAQMRMVNSIKLPEDRWVKAEPV